jgi:hypothetical protein
MGRMLYLSLNMKKAHRGEENKKWEKKELK